MLFDGASRTDPTDKIITRVGVIFVSPENHVLPRAFSLTEPLLQQHSGVQCFTHRPPARSTNGVQYLEAYSYSKLLVNQVKGEYEIRYEDLIPYHHATIKLVDSFYGFYIRHVSRLLNTKVDALAALRATVVLLANTTYRLTVAAPYSFV